MTNQRKLRIIAALLAIVGVFSAGRFIKKYKQDYPWPKGGDYASIYESRYVGLKKSLPAGDILGYVSEEHAKDLIASQSLRYTQYALTPKIVIPKSDQCYIVANFPGGKAPDDVKQDKSLLPVKDCRLGVMLYHKRQE